MTAKTVVRKGFIRMNYAAGIVSPFDPKTMLTHVFGSKSARTRWLKKLDQALAELNAKLGLEGQQQIHVKMVKREYQGMGLLHAGPVAVIIEHLEKQFHKAAT